MLLSACGGRAKDTARFKNKRAEMFWLLREGMEQGKVTLPEDDELVADLYGVPAIVAGTLVSHAMT